MTDTINYYNENAKGFACRTKDIDFTETQDRFLGYLKPGAKVLDFGCGSGRDTKYFLDKGFMVDAIDGSLELVKIASEFTKQEVKHMLFQELDEKEAYDGIWACASILHLTREELKKVLVRMNQALVQKGFAYLSFKYGTDEGERNGRFFMDMTEEKVSKLLEEASLFIIKEIWVSSDVRPGRAEEKWLNIIVQKKE